MPAANPFPSVQQVPPQPVPALNLFPLNDTFIPKHIHLNQRVKIGRQTNAKTVPGERNGYFDSKVLSRQHAEVWEENGKIYIKDVKSSNGTFINGERLSPEGVESDPYELKSDDVVEFGIDIVGEDNKTIIHHKVAARVTCVINPEDALVAPRDPAHYNGPASAFQSPNPLHPQPGQPNHVQQRRPGALAPPSTASGLGSMGAPAGRPGTTKSGLTFEHILSRLQNGLIQSRETGQELGRLGDQMGDIGDTLGGNNPGPIHTYPQSLPPIRPHVSEAVSQQPPSHATVPSHLPHPAPPSPNTLASLQSQLAETQSTLAAHVEKIRALERLSEFGNLAKEHEAIKREVGLLRGMIHGERLEAVQHDVQDDGDDDETRSVCTVTVVEDDDSHMEHTQEEIEEQQQSLLGRPRTPEPTMGMHSFRDEDDEANLSVEAPVTMQTTSPPPLPLPPPSHCESTQELAMRLATLSDQLENALAVSRNLQAQQNATQSTIHHLEAKVVALESLVHRATAATHTATAATPAHLQHPQPLEEPESSLPQSEELPATGPTGELLTWQRSIEQKWSGVHEDWSQERLRLDRAREEWEDRMRKLEQEVQQGLKVVPSVRSGSNDGTGPFVGLVTPPSPRSLSADSNKPRRRRSRSDSGGPRSSIPRSLGDAGQRNGNGAAHGFKTEVAAVSYQGDREGLQNGYAHKSSTTLTASHTQSFVTHKRDPALFDTDQGHRHGMQRIPAVSVSTAVGVLLLSLAAAAVYRVRE